MAMKRAATFVTCGAILLSIPLVVQNLYIIHLFIITGIYSIVVMSVTLQNKLKLWNLGAAVFWGIGAYCSALFSTELGLSFWICLPSSAIVSAVFALCFGIVFVRVGSIGFLLLTILVNGIFVHALGHADSLGGWDGISGIPKPAVYLPFHTSLEFTAKTPYYYLLLFLVLLVLVAFCALYRSRIGRAWRAIGLAAPLGASIGINLFRYRLLAFVIAGFTSGMAGSFYAYYQGFVVPGMFELTSSFYFMLYAVLGGLAYPVSGPVLGSFIGVVVPELLRVGEMYERIFFGAVIILVLLFLREGVASLWPRVTVALSGLDRRIKFLF